MGPDDAETDAPSARSRLSLHGPEACSDRSSAIHVALKMWGLVAKSSQHFVMTSILSCISPTRGS